jgi:choline dehydrogenase-like flavoprotein
VRVDADLVVVACGTIHTPVLLHRSGVRHPQLGRNLSLHPASGVWAEMDEDVDMHAGVPQAYAVDEFAAEGLMLEGWTGPPDMLALSLPATGDGAAPRDARLPPRRAGRADDPRPLARARARRRAQGAHPLRRRRARHALLVRGIARAAELELAAGARRVHVPIAGAGPVSTPAQARALTVRRASQLGLTAFHPLGTAAAGTVVDADLRMPGVDGLLVADGSVVPGALGVNPQLTIMALATRAAFRTLGREAPTEEPVSESVGRAPALTR